MPAPFAPLLAALLACALGAGCAAPDAPPPPPAAVADTASAPAAPLGPWAAGETVYVPVYSHIYHQEGDREFDLTATLSVRNADPRRPIVVTAVRYYDSHGALVRTYIDAPLRLAPLASRPFVVAERDRTGGVGASFIVEWRAENEVASPVVEAVMISTASTQGISFVSPGRVIDRLP